MFESKPIGTKTVRKIQVLSCKECGIVIDTGDLCSYGCPNDGISRNKGETVMRTWERTDVLLKEEMI